MIVQNSSLWIVFHKMRMPFIVIILTYTISITGLLIIEGVDSNGNPYHMSIFDAFYFITYTATTIGFGETPYEFTYAQRLWVSFCVYLTVIGWFYGVGALISLLQNKMFLHEISRVRFKRQVKAIRKKYIILLGYNYITSEIIKRLLDADIRAVVIEKDEERVNSLILESYTPTVPVLLDNVHSPKSLEAAGISRLNCKAVVSLFNNDALNLRIGIVSKLLNKNITLAVKATHPKSVNNLNDINAEIIVNPFVTIANELKMAIQSPHLLKLEKWLYQIDTLDAHMPKLPIGRYIVCGFGRMGQSIYRTLKDEKEVDLFFIERNKKKLDGLSERELQNFIVADADDKEVLEQAGVKEAVAIVAFTNNDTVNISILATARKLNSSILTLAREDEMDDVSIFSNAQMNYLFMPSKIIINKITNALINPLADQFARCIMEKDEAWAMHLVKDLLQKIDNAPLLYEMTINEQEAPEVINFLEKSELMLSIFQVSLHNRHQHNNVIPLLLLRSDDTIVLPHWNMPIRQDDKILFACDAYAQNDIEYIAQNPYEFYYALTGEEKTIFKQKVFK